MAVPTRLDLESYAGDNWSHTVQFDDDAGEDSHDILPAMLGEERISPIRECTVHHSANGSFAIRRGAWKLLIHQGSGGNKYPDFADESPVQLYKITSDEGEDRNVWREHPDVVQELAALFFRVLDSGRSTPGEPQPNNDGENRWKQVEAALAALGDADVRLE